MNGGSFRIRGVSVRVSFPFLAALTVGAFLDAELTTAVGCGVGVHEAAHLLLLRAFRLPVRGIDCCLSGIRIHSESGRGSVLCALAGPLANLLLGAALLRVWRLGAAASLLLGGIHLLPLPGTDGEVLLRLLRPERRDRAARLFCAGLFLLTALLCACGQVHPLIPAALLTRLLRQKND